MIEQLAEGTTLMRPPGLGAVYGVKGLVQEQSDSPAKVDPGRAILIERGSVP
jgi:hypothetical protein